MRQDATPIKDKTIPQVAGFVAVQEQKPSTKIGNSSTHCQRLIPIANTFSADEHLPIPPILYSVTNLLTSV